MLTYVAAISAIILAATNGKHDELHQVFLVPLIAWIITTIAGTLWAVGSWCGTSTDSDIVIHSDIMFQKHDDEELERNATNGDPTTGGDSFQRANEADSIKSVSEKNGRPTKSYTVIE